MKFTVLTEFKGADRTFEEGNSHSTEALGIPEQSVERWYRQGWVQIDGMTPAPELDPNRTELEVQNASITPDSKTVS